MPANFPASYDALSNPAGTDPLTTPSHSGQHGTGNDILEAIEQRVGLSGSSFPGGPTSGQFFHRTDRRLDYYYDGTRWLTTHLYEWPIGFSDALLPFTGTVVAARARVPHAGIFDLWLEKFAVTFKVNGGTALSGSHKWVVTYNKQPGAVNIATVNIDSGASDVYRVSATTNINALIGITNFAIDATATKTGTPGSLELLGSITYRLVG